MKTGPNSGSRPAIIAAVMGSGTAAWGAAITATWASGTTGDWNDGGNWSFSAAPTTATFPNNDANDTFGVLIDNGGVGNSTTNLNANVTIDSLGVSGGVSGGDTLNFSNSFDMTITSGSINNSGLISLNGTAGLTELTLQGAALITGTGTLRLNDSTSNRLIGTTGNSITQSAGHTIEGGGSVLIGIGGFVNQGTIVANDTTALSIDPGAEGFDNTGGTLRAESGSTLNLLGGDYTNTLGTIEAAGPGSNVTLGSLTTFTGGSFTTTGGGQIQSVVSSGGVPVLDGVTITTGSNLVQNTSFDTTIRNGITNNGTWNLNATSGLTDINVDGSQTIGGTGEIVMSDSSVNRILTSGTTASTDIVTLDATQTVRGAGQILTGAGGLLNNGSIRQQGTVELLINPGVSADAGGGANFVNNGVLRAEGTGGILLSSGIYDNNTAIEATGGNVRLGSQVQILGGNLTSSGGNAIFSIVNGAAAPVLDGVTITAGSNLVQNNSFDTTIRNGITNNGTWNLNATSTQSDIGLDGSQTIGGTGEIVMSDSGVNRIITTGATVATDIVTLASTQTVRGAGQILAGGGGFINNGSIRQQGTVALLINPGISSDAGGGANFVNNGVLRAEGTGGILLSSGIYDNNTAIEATGGNVTLGAQVQILGGNLTSSGGNAFFSIVNGSGAPVLDGVTITAGSNLVQNNSFDTTIRNGITNNGTWNLNATSSQADIGLDGSQTIGGTGEIVMSDGGLNRVITSGGTASTDIVTLDATQTIRGAGQILIGQGGFLNNGAIRQQGTVALTINPGLSADAGLGANFVNNGVLRAEGTGGILLASGTYDNNTAIEATGGDVRLGAQVQILGGNLTSSGGNSIRIDSFSASAPILDGVTVTSGSTIIQNNQFDATIRNGITNNGTWNLNGTSSTTEIFAFGSQTIGGTGEIVMSDSGVNRIVMTGATAATDIVTLGANQTIRGSGAILVGTGGFVNNGTIDATGNLNAAISLSAGTPGFVNNGTLRASGALGIDIANGANFTQANGLMDVQTGSRLDVVFDNYVQTGGQTTVNGTMTTASLNSSIQLQGGRFGGSGTVDFNGAGVHVLNNIGGTMAVGNSPGHLTITDGDYVQAVTAAFEFELFGAVAGVSHDLLTILNGDADLSGNINVIADALFASTLTVGETFEVIQLDTGAFTSGFFDNLTVNLVGLDFIQFFGANGLGGTSLFLQVTQADVVVDIAEPQGILIVLTGLGFIAAVRRRRAAA